MTRIWGALAGTLLGTALAFSATAEEVTVDMHAVSDQGVGEKIGTVRLFDGDGGMVIDADLTELSPGPHGFHLHENPSCEPARNDEGMMAAAMAAGGHYDPENTGKHMGPSGRGHKGDLPVIQVLATEDGAEPFKRVEVAPALTVAEARGHALVIHAQGDNYSDEPKPLGGGGARIACGVLQ